MKISPLINKNSSKNILVFDVGTSAVSGFWVSKNEGKIPEIKAAAKSNLRLLERPDLKNMSEYVKRTLFSTADALKENLKGEKISQIFVVLSSPWFLSETRTVRMSRDSDFIVTERLIDDLIAEEVILFKKRSEENLSVSANKLQILEEVPMQIMLNGYRVPSPIMKKARELILKLYISVSRREFVEAIFGALKQHFGEVSAAFKSEPLTLFGALKDMTDCEKGFILVDVGGEMTEVLLVRRYVIENVSTFPRGGNFIIRRIASSLKMGLEESLAILRSKTRGDLKNELDAKVSRVLEDAGYEWSKSLSEALLGLGKENALPQDMILIGGASGIETLKKYSEAADLSHLTILGRPFNVIIFMPENSEARINPGVLDRKDPQLTLPLLLIAHLSENGWK